MTGPYNAPLSFSSLKTYSECGRQFQLVKEERAPQDEMGYFAGGKAVHETIEACEAVRGTKRKPAAPWWTDPANFTSRTERDPDGDGPAIRHFRKVLDRLVAEVGGRDAIRWGGRKTAAWDEGEDDRWWHANGPMQLRTYRTLRQRWHDTGIEVLPGAVEMKVGMVLPGCRWCGFGEDDVSHVPGTERFAHPFEQVTVTGYVDTYTGNWVNTATGEVEQCVIDYKTGKVSTGDPFQHATYAECMHTAEPERFDPTVGVTVYLRGKEYRTQVKVHDLRPARKLVIPRYAAYRRALDSGVRLAVPSWKCGGCTVLRFCNVGQAEVGEAKLIDRAIMPLDDEWATRMLDKAWDDAAAEERAANTKPDLKVV